MKYVVSGSWFTNDINFADGRKVQGLMGGCGLFAFCGVLQYTDNVTFVGEVGNDLEEVFGKWLEANNVSCEGFVPYDNRTILATMVYEPDGQWHETFQFGPPAGSEDKARRMAALDHRLDEIRLRDGVKAMYVNSIVADQETHEKIRHMREDSGMKVMWELRTGDCIAENLEALVNKALPCYDMYSLNRTESYTLFSVDNEEEAIQKILAIGLPCFFRAGSKGSYMIMDGQVAFMPTVNLVPREQEIDPTGCGNCSTGAAMWAYTEGYDIYEIAAIANVAAAYNVQQYGIWPDYSDKVRKEALKTALRLASEAKANNG